MLLDAAPQAPQEPLVFRTGTDLVTIDALVTDGKGEVVQGLTKADFQIVEKGRPQTISAFTFMSTPLIERKQFDPVPVAPIRDVVSNRVAPHSRAYAIVIDDLHLVELHIERTRRMLTDLLGSIPLTDRVAVIFTGRSDLSVDLTDDRAAEMLAVGRLKDALGFALDPVEVACGAKEAQRRHQALGTLDVLRNVATILAHTKADERSIVYVSEGFTYDFNAAPVSGSLPTFPGVPPVRAPQKGQRLDDPIACDVDGLATPPISQTTLPGNPQENPGDADLVRRTLQDIFDAATRADVRVYTIDPRGNLPPEAEVRGSPKGQPKITTQNDFMRSVAANTGALAAVQASDMHWAVRKVLSDTSSYYLLGYTPDPLARDGQYHEIEVKVLRPGLHVRYRKGYTAPQTNAHVLVGEPALSADLAGGDATADLSLASFVAPIAADGKLTKTAITIEVTYPGPSSVPASVSDDLTCEILQADVEGAARTVSTKAYHFAVTPTRTGDFTFFINSVVDLAPGLANLRVGVVSKATGKVGTVAIPTRIPDLSGGALQMTALVLGRPAAGEPSLPPGALAGVLPFQPTLARTFASRETLRVYAPISWRGSADTASVTLTMTGSGVRMSRTLTVRAAAAVGGVRQSAIDEALPLGPAAPGNYALVVTATIPGGKPVSRTVGITVTR
jgi:VWFA-related protein